MSQATKPAPPPGAAEHRPPARMPRLIIPSRFRGPSRSGNGGYVCGRIAAYADGPVTVTLRRPPPLATPMAVERGGEGSLRICHGRTLIAEAISSPGPALEIPGPVSMAEARTAAGHARYFQDPVFPDCFVCGMSRRPGDGLRIFPGPVPGRELWAAPWTPDPSVAGTDGRVRPEVAWAALDCPRRDRRRRGCRPGPGHRHLARPDDGQPGGAACAQRPLPDDRLAGRGDGRKLTAGSALLGPGGEVLAVARAVWITVPRPVPAVRTEGAS